MRRSSGLLPSFLLTASLLLGCSGDPTPVAPPPPLCEGHAFEGKGARVFAVQPRIERDNMVSYEAFRGHIAGLVDKQIKPCLAVDRPNLIVFPEDVGLPAAFIGSRGAKARTAQYAAEAFIYLPSKYQGPMSHYDAIWPDLALLQSLGLALTDTLWRAFYETMRDVAVSTGAHVIASVNVSGDIERSEDPAEIEALKDPDLEDPSYVYVARDRAIYNTAFVIDPTGEVVARARKPYLVESEEIELRLAYGALRDVAPIDVGFGLMGILTSKDAWMPDMVDRLAASGAKLIVQPEAFSGWGIEEVPGDWLPDVVTQSAWAAVQKHGAYRYGVIPHLTGNLFDQVFDGQSAIVGDWSPELEELTYVGQEPRRGFLAVAPWVISDPSIENPALSLEERRATLRAAGEARKPGGSAENDYIETVIAADIDVTGLFRSSPPGGPGALGSSSSLSSAVFEEQSAPAIASDGAGNVVIAFQGDRDVRPQIYVSRSTDSGAFFTEEKPVAPSMGAQRAPSIVEDGSTVHVAWQERDPGGEARVVVARSEDGGDTFSAPVSPGPPAEMDAWGPALATDGASVFLAFIAGGSGNERVMVARSPLGGGPWQIVPADPEPPAFEPLNIRNNQWSPAIAATNDEVSVAWVDFRAYSWDVLLSRSTDGGQTFGLPSRVDDAGSERERIHDDPALLYVNGELLCAWSDVRDRKATAKARAARALKASSSFGPGVVLGDPSPTANAWRPQMTAITAQGAPAVAALIQAHGEAKNGVRLAVSSDTGVSFGQSVRIDDAGDAQAFAPRMARVAPSTLTIVWEDTRSGTRRVRFVTGSL